MERKDFLRNSIGFLGLATTASSFLKKNENLKNNMLNNTSCTVTSNETAGPFPTISPASLVTNNIIGDRTGVDFTINIIINNINANCNALEGAIVDIWHCDKDGYYSEYGGTSMQPQNFQGYHFLRGRQTTNENGLVSFTSIFPGWYQSRATHIHVHIYDATGSSLLITQIAFPEDTNSAVVQVNSATSYGYTKGMTGYTYNANDNVFSDSVSNEMSTITGSIADGFTLDHTIYVAGSTLSTNDVAMQHFTISQNYPNPLKDKSTITLELQDESNVSLQIFDLTGRLIAMPINSSFPIGTSNLIINRDGMNNGYYIYKVKVSNEIGTFEQSKKFLVE